MLPLLTVDEALAGDPPQPSYFIGRVRMQNLSATGGTKELEYFAVFFDAGAHTRPHTHATDQVLYFVRGTGFVWVAGEERQLTAPGTVVVVPAGVVHMHGATPDEAMCHIAVRAPGPADWDPTVPDEWRQYQHA
jgi:quercetin dioxygenase-like cupin family protein